MQEFFVVVTRRLDQPLDEEEALDALDDLAATGRVLPIDARLVRDAAERAIVSQLSLWDALIVCAADRAGCTHVVTEDLSHGQVIGRITIESPFLE